jgi:putative hydrolase of the HAD superfamily
MFPATIRGVIFDAVGTILCPGRPIATVYQSYAARYGIEADPQLLLKRFLEAFRRSDKADEANQLRVSEASEQQRWREIVGFAFQEFRDAPWFEELFQSLFAHYALPSSWQLYDDVTTCWRTLQTAGLRVGIGSNYDSRLTSVVAGHPTLAANDGLFISSLVGYRKPSVEFYRTIERNWQLAPEQLLMIGDDVDNDYDGGLAAGWQVVLIDRADRFANRQSVRNLTDIHLASMSSANLKPGESVQN